MITTVSVLFITCITAAMILFGWQPSISNIFNVLPKGYKWLFTLFMCVIGVFCMFIGKNNTMVLMGFSCMLVGFFPRFNDDQGLQHYIAAVGIIGSGMWQVGAVMGLWGIPVSFLILSLTIHLTKMNNRLFWIEMVAFGGIIGGLFISA